MKRTFTLSASIMFCASMMMPAIGQTPCDDDRAKSLLANALNARNPETRKAAVKALKTVAVFDPFATQLETMLNDKDVPVRLATVEALAGLKTGRAIAALKTALNDRVPEVRFAAATELFKLNDPEGRDFLMGVLSGEVKISSGIVASHIREAIRTTQIPSELAIIALKQGISMAPVPYLGMGFSAMQEVMAHRGVSGRAATALLLGKLKDSEAIAALEDALADKEASVRAAAAQSLAMVDDPATKQDVAAMVAPLLRDKNQGVRLHAAASYLRLAYAPSTQNVAGVDE
jgi:HEAT repeat protein